MIQRKYCDVKKKKYLEGEGVRYAKLIQRRMCSLSLYRPFIKKRKIISDIRNTYTGFLKLTQCTLNRFGVFRNCSQPKLNSQKKESQKSMDNSPWCHLFGALYLITSPRVSALGGNSCYIRYDQTAYHPTKILARHLNTSHYSRSRT